MQTDTHLLLRLLVMPVATRHCPPSPSLSDDSSMNENGDSSAAGPPSSQPVGVQPTRKSTLPSKSEASSSLSSASEPLADKNVAGVLPAAGGPYNIFICLRYLQRI